MKSKLLAISLCLLTNFSIAQKSNKNELGLILYSNEMPFFKSGLINLYQNTDMIHAFVNGIQYKRSLKHNFSLRASAQYLTHIESYSFDFISSETGSGNYAGNSKVTCLDTRIGIEKVFLKTKIKPYVLFDLIYANYFSESKGTQYDYSTNRAITTNYDYEVNYAGVNFGLGAKYYINEHLYTSAEASIGSVIQLYTGWDAEFQIYQPRSMFTFGVRF